MRDIDEPEDGVVDYLAGVASLHSAYLLTLSSSVAISRCSSMALMAAT